MFFASSPLWARAFASFAVLFGLFLAATDAMAQVRRPGKVGQFYQVRIDSAPQQATIYLDDKSHGPVGRTPWQGRLQKGDWTIILEKDGYEPTERQFRVVRTRQLQEAFVSLREKAQPARLEITGASDPNTVGAEVWLSGKRVGTIPIDVEVEQGRQLVEVKKEGFEDFQQWINAADGQTITLTPALRAIAPAGKGRILVHADVPGAQVFLDGERQAGSLPLLLDDVPEGVRELEVRAPSGASWKQAVEVKANETSHVRAQLAGDAGRVRVLSNIEGATVLLDGIEVGQAPVDLSDVRPGEHVVEVRAPGYASREERIEVTSGDSMVIKLDLERGVGGDATIKVVSPVPEAEVFINGERVGAVPQSRDVYAGEHFVVVSKEGFRDFQERIEIQPGQTITVTAELRAVGEVRFVSNPSGADIYLDGEPIGVTPHTAADVTVGEHVVAFRAPGYIDHERTFSVEGGQSSVINATLEMLDIGPTAAELEREVRSLVSYGARTLPRGRSTIDLAAGYPYWLDARITVGASDFRGFGFDAGVFARTFFSRTEVGLSSRWRLFEESPFSFGAFTNLGAGGNFFDDSHRNTFFTDLGVVASLSALKYVTVSGRAYLNAWTDRHCPRLEAGAFPVDAKPHSTCEQYRQQQLTGSSDLSGNDLERLERLVSDPFRRENGVRAMVSGVVELAVEQRWNLWMLFEGAPFQKQRAGYTNYFNGGMLSDNDVGTYLRFGATLKF
jgi:hypothetical protein